MGARACRRRPRHRRRRDRRTAARRRSCSTCRSSRIPATPVPSWWFDAAAGGGWLGASGSHVVDQVRVWLGEIAEVERDAQRRLGPRRRGRGHVHGSMPLRIRCRRRAAADGRGVGPVRGDHRVAGHGRHAVDRRRRAVARRPDGVRRLDVPPDLALPAPPTESDDPRHRFTHLELGPFTRLCEVLRAGVEGRPLPDAVPLPTFARRRRRDAGPRRDSRASPAAERRRRRRVVDALSRATRASRSGRGDVCAAKGSRRGGPSGRCRMADRDDDRGTTCVGSASSAASSSANAVVSVVSAEPRPERGRGEQQVLGRGEDRRRDRHLEAPRRCRRTTTITHRRTAVTTARDAAVDLCEERRRRAASQRSRGHRLPTPAR